MCRVQWEYVNVAGNEVNQKPDTVSQLVLLSDSRPHEGGFERRPLRGAGRSLLLNEDHTEFSSRPTPRFGSRLLQVTLEHPEGFLVVLEAGDKHVFGFRVPLL